MNLYFLADQYQGEIRNNEPDKCASIDWFELENLPSNMAEIDKQVIENYKNGKGLIEYGWK